LVIIKTILNCNKTTSLPTKTIKTLITPCLRDLATDWTIWATGGTMMDVRYSHHLTMYFIIVWVMFHIYYQIWRTIFWKEADISIVVGGAKYVKEKEVK